MSESFGKWRYRFWPVHAHEYCKVMPLLLMKLLVALNYTMLFNTKETLMIAASAGSGAEVIPILKGWLVIPAAFIFMIYYAKMSNQLNSKQLFYATISPFLIFFALFAFILYPNREALSPGESAVWLQEWLGPQRTHWVAIYKYWMNAAFYVFAELWGVVVINLLFWTFANQICSIGEAKRFYTLFSTAGDLGAVFSAPLMWHSTLLGKSSGFDGTLQYVLYYTLIIGVIVIALYSWTYWYADIKETQSAQSLKNKPKLSLVSSFKMILRSSYLMHLSFIVISYSFALNLIEVFWKANLKMAYPQASDYLQFMSYFSFCTGLISVIITFIAAGFIIRRFGWHVSAQITPILVCSSGLIFFTVYYQQESLSPFFSYFNLTPILFLAYFGAAQNILSRTCKYAFLDPTKEMAYIPLDEESKIKGKAAVDVVASRLGKSGSSWVQAGLIELIGSGSVLSIAGFIVPIITATGALWSHAVFSLNKQFTKKINQQKSHDTV
jgi:AAA family ATP:ADP antiporter